MRVILLLLLSLSFHLTAFGKGGAGTYYMKGIAYGADKVVLKNATLTVEIGDETKTILTNESGEYEIEVHWWTACPSGITRLKWKRETNRINPNHIFVKFGKIEIKIKNDWEKYTNVWDEPTKKMKKLDLLFV